MARKISRNAQGNGTIRQRKSDDLWEARFTVGRDPATGKQVQKSIYGKTQKEVAAKLRKVITDVEDGIYIKSSKLTVAQWLNIWVEEYTGGIKERTYLLYKSHVKNYLIPSIGAVKLNGLNTPTIQRMYNSFQRREKHLSPKTIKNIHGVLNRALEQAVSIEYIRTNPCKACIMPRGDKPEIKPLDSQQIFLFLEAIKGHRYETFYLVALFTGFRQGELLGLTWDCINFDNGTMKIYRQLQLIEGKYKFTSLKNDKPRYITPATYIMQLLKNHRRTQIEWRMQAGNLWQDENFVFTDELGYHLSRQTVYKTLKRIMASIRLPDTRFHDLRHTYAVSALQAGDNVKAVQANLGHHTAAFTLDVYGHVTEEMQKESAAKMDAFIKSVTR